MLSMLNNIQDMVGMDPKSFYALFISIAMPIIGAVCNGFKTLLKVYGEIRWVKFYRKEENFIFNVSILYVEVLYFMMSYVLIYLCFKILFAYKFKTITVLLYTITISVLLGLLFARLILGFKYVKKCFIHVKKERYLVYSFMILANLYLWMSFVYSVLNARHRLSVFFYVFASILIILLVIIEAIELICLDYSYTTYKFSHVLISTEQGEIIDCHIRNIKRKWNMLIIENEKEIIKLKYDNIRKLEYYGEPVYIVNKPRLSSK